MSEAMSVIVGDNTAFFAMGVLSFDDAIEGKSVVADVEVATVAIGERLRTR